MSTAAITEFMTRQHVFFLFWYEKVYAACKNSDATSHKPSSYENSAELWDMKKIQT